MNKRIETIILQHLIADLKFALRVLPHMTPELFRDRRERALFKVIREHVTKYTASPTFEQLFLALESHPLNQEDYDSLVEYMNSEVFRKVQHHNSEWLMDETEKFIRQELVHNSVISLIAALDEKKPVGAVVEAVKEADTFTFNSSVGYDPLTNWELVYNALMSQDEQFPFELQAFQENIGGVRRKSQNVILASTSVGKSLTLVHLTGEYLRQGKTVVYISVELDHVKISKRIQATLLDVDIKTLEGWTPAEYKRRMDEVDSVVKGTLRVQDYPTGKAHVGHFKAFLDDLKQKEGIIPDVIMVDYLNLCTSRAMRGTKNANRYQTVGSISNEFRALAQETNTVLWTATQTNRNGYKSEADMENTSELYEINSGCDLLLGISKDERNQNSLKFRVLKNRDGELKHLPFSVAVKRARMRLYDADDIERTNDAMQTARIRCREHKSGRNAKSLSSK